MNLLQQILRRWKRQALTAWENNTLRVVPEGKKQTKIKPVKKLCMIIKQNRKHKDSVFVNLFYSDKTAETNLLSLSNTLHRGKFEEPVLIKKIKIENVL